jgi:hypothetical protein
MRRRPLLFLFIFDDFRQALKLVGPTRAMRKRPPIEAALFMSRTAARYLVLLASNRRVDQSAPKLNFVVA